MRHITAFGALVAAAITLPAPLAAAEGAPAPLETATDPPAEQPAAPMGARDLVTLPRLGAPAINREGTLAAFSVTLTDPTSLARSQAHYLIDLTRPGSAPIALDLGPGAASLAFGADGALHFLSSRSLPGAESGASPRSRVWRVAVGRDGTLGAPTPVTPEVEADVEGFKLSPDGRAIALWGAVPRACPRFGCPEMAPAHLPGPGSGRLYDSTTGFVRHWDRWASPGIHNRIFVYPLAEGVAVGDGVPADGRDPESGITADSPTMPFGGGEEMAFAADGSALYFTARLADADEPTSTNLDIYVSDLSGGAPRNLTAANRASDTAPVVSPDGRHLAFLAMARPGYEADRQVVQLLDLETGRQRALTEAVDLSFASLAWSADGKSLIATAQKVLDTPAFRIDIASGKVEELDLIAGAEAHIANLAALPGGRLIFTRDSLGHPAELFLAQGARQARPLTDIATTRMGAMANIITRRFRFAGAGGAEVWGQITRLADQTGPIPALLFIHGGPQGSFNDAWSTRWNPRVFASQGYAVIAIDFHGSTGYGQAFTDAIREDWGGKPLEDLQKGLAAALALDPQIDGSRACALGASYGGYMINWIAGQWPDRFACLVNHNGLFDTRAFAYATEELWFPHWDFGGTYEAAREAYERWNPANHVSKWQTPMLVVLGEKDFRVPYTQGLGAYTALKLRGVPAQLLVFPDENHWVLGAKNSLQWHETVFAWLARWLKADKGR